MARDPIILRPGESITRKGDARNVALLADGWLVLTNERVCFREYRIGTPPKVLERIFPAAVELNWALSEIVSVRHKRSWLVWFGGYFEFLTDDNSRHVFSVEQPKLWVQEISDAALKQ